VTDQAQEHPVLEVDPVVADQERIVPIDHQLLLMIGARAWMGASGAPAATVRNRADAASFVIVFRL